MVLSGGMLAIEPEQATRARKLNELVALAASGVAQMLDPETQLFCNAFARTPRGLRRTGVSHRYTMITLLGLQRLERAGGESPVDIGAVLEALLRDLTWLQGAGDLGLLLWTCADLAPERLADVCARVQPRSALRRFADARSGYTMEVAWLLTGLARCLDRAPDAVPGAVDLALAAFQLLERNCGARGIFGHLASTASLTGRLRGRVGSFADQVYPIYALSQLARILDHDRAARMALRTAETLCEHQGPLGQWWWHYNARTGDVAGHYAVYSVHQHAMAPMALMAVGAIARRDFSAPIFDGLEWVRGRNEFHLDMRDPTNGVIWRCVSQGRYRSRANKLRYLTGLKGSPRGLRIVYECRPYELGWLLYAFAGPPRRTIVHGAERTSING